VSRVLVVSSERVGPAMAGPAIRASELARVLTAAGHEVSLVAAGDDRGEVGRLAAAQDTIVVQGWALERVPALAHAEAALVVDLYDPFALELLMLLERAPAAERAQAQANALRAMHDQLRAGDFFLCASERQRDYWLGWLEALGRINPLTHAADSGLRTLIDVVPFGIPAEPPERTGPGCREAFGIGAEEVVLLWGGGVYDWLDPVTVVRGAARVEGVQLVFMAAGHPNPGQPPSRALEEARREGGERTHFNEAWVEYTHRADWLLDADVGVSAHLDHVEARFAFRTRILDYLWAGLPVLCTAGDALADEVARDELGLTPPPLDVDAWAEAIAALANDPDRRAGCAQRARARASEMTWERVARPLLEFCAAPRRAPDLAAGGPLHPTRERPLTRRWLAERLRGRP
jgi:glycosyltransferase involved in cell wall biosynthesis